MRKIKFRVWLKNRSEMRSVKKINFEESYSFYGQVPPHVVVEGYCDIFPFEEVELMQGWLPEYQPDYTIYEGDIISVHWFSAAVDPSTLGVYEDECNVDHAEVIDENGILGFYWQDYFLPLGFVPAHEESFEVIGNIYENKELLK